MLKADHEESILKTFLLFIRTADSVKKYMDSYFYVKAGLSTVKFMALQILASNGGTMRPSELAELMLRERHNITTLVSRLERDGLVRTRRNDRDRRTVDITVTDLGREVLDKVMPLAKEIVNQVMLSVTMDDAALLEKKLRILKENSHHGIEHTGKSS